MTAASAVSLASIASGALDKPVIDPEFPDGGLDSLAQGLTDNLASVEGGSWKAWDAGWIPKDCKSIAEDAEFAATDIIPFDISYPDCPDDPWVFCRHKDSPMSEDTIVDIWGKVPVRMRSFVRHMVFLPGDASAGSSGDNVQMNGDLGITVFIHENAHSLDPHAFDPELGDPFSDGQTWLDAYDADSAVPDSYAQSSQQENFAQQAVVAIFDNVVPDGLGTVQPNWQAIFNQYDTLRTNIGDTIVPGGECANRLENSESVSMDDSARSSLNIASKPDRSLSKNVTAIEPITMGKIQLTKFGKAKGSNSAKLRM